MTKRIPIVPTIVVLGAVAVLIWLGAWQLQRAKWTPLNGTWRFRYDDHAELTSPDDVDRWPQEITVP